MPPPAPSPFNRNPDRLPSQSVPQYLLDCLEASASPRFELPELLKDSLYYPACGLNGTPIKHLSDFVHSFVYADYWISEEDYLRDLHHGTALLGYRCMHERALQTHDIVPTGWRPPILPPRDQWERLQRQESRAKPFGRWSLWQRLPDFPADHGPECLSLLFFGGEMSALYQGLYNRLEIAPKVIALIQPGAMGGDGIPKRHQGVYAQSDYMLEPRNPQITVGTRLLKNVQSLQLQNDIFTDEMIYHAQFGIEMETGTGKTYVYIRSILTLYEEYGFKKFMIVVPSVAIRKGVEKTLEQLQTHLKALHNVDIAKHSFVYDSGNIGRLKAFVENHDLDICVINAQAFAGAKTIIQKEQEQGGEILWERIKDIHPIVIIDEPQKVEGNSKKPSKSRLQLSELSPLFELKYSATHRQEFPLNMLYSLNSHAAYEQQLVKRIRVKTVYGQIPKDQPYIRYVKFNKDLTANIELFTQTQGGRIKAGKHRVENNADLRELSGGLSQYADFRVAAQPHKEAPLRIQSRQGEITLDEGATNMELAQDQAKRIQIRLAIECHFEKQWELLDNG